MCAVPLGCLDPEWVPTVETPDPSGDSDSGADGLEPAGDSGSGFADSDDPCPGDCELAPGVLTLSAATYLASEADPGIDIEVRRVHGDHGVASTWVSTRYLGNDPGVSNPAEDVDFGNGGDYDGRFTELVFADGETSRIFRVDLFNDTVADGDRVFEVRLYDASADLVQPTTAVVTIVDDDDTSSPDPCAGVDCSGHGECVTAGAAASCVCGVGYVAAGTTCVPEGGHCAGGLAAVGPQCLDVDTPPWPMEVAGFNLTRAHPALLYTTRIAVRGGVYPYQFALESKPATMTIDPRTGVISWTPPAPADGQAVRVEITDATGAVLVHSFTITATIEGFRFVAPNGDDSAAGSMSRPWRTWAHALTAGGSDAIIVFRAGTYDAASGEALSSGTPMAFIAFPGEPVTWDLGGNAIGVRRAQDERLLLQGIEVQNGGAKLFWFGAQTSHVVFWRSNLHGVYSESANNPSFMFFEDAGGHLVAGSDAPLQYTDIVVQENTMHDQRSTIGHGGGVVLYNVQRFLCEDNHVFDMDGVGLQDKDDGYRNIFRNNVIHQAGMGIVLANQYTQREIEVSHNLIHDVGQGIVIGWQPGYIRDVWVHHNTVVGEIVRFRPPVVDAQGGNVNVYANILVGGDPLYEAREPEIADAIFDHVRADGNLLWTAGDIYTARWAGEKLDFQAWQARGMDERSVVANPGLDASHALPVGSPYRGIYGRE
jgi:hypothetical protein